MTQETKATLQATDFKVFVENVTRACMRQSQKEGFTLYQLEMTGKTEARKMAINFNSIPENWVDFVVERDAFVEAFNSFILRVRRESRTSILSVS
jgi:hypothetical protein